MQAGQAETFGEENLYPYARRCLGELQQRGQRVEPGGNQTARAERILKALDLLVDVIGTAAGWGVEKPSPAFFARLIEDVGCAAASVLYVGDRLDNDVRPAQEADISTALIRRGPWGYLFEDETVRSRCLFQLTGLAELPGLIRAHNARQS